MTSTPEPIPMILRCPECAARHIDVGEFATRVHHTHACQNCGAVWRPAIVPTVGVQFLPGFKNADEAEDNYTEKNLADCVVNEFPIWENSNRPAVWMITALAKNERFGGIRHVYACSELNVAHQLVLKNAGDIWEHSYNLVVIQETILNAMYSVGDRRSYWYRWNVEKKAYEPVICPKFKDRLDGWAVG